MKGVLFLRPEAEQDLAAARDWYDQQRAGLGDEFLDALALALRVLARDPELTRRDRIGGFQRRDELCLVREFF